MGHGKILDRPTPTEAIDFRLALGQQDGRTPTDPDPAQGSLISIGDIRTRGRLERRQATQGGPLGGRTQTGVVDVVAGLGALCPPEPRQAEHQAKAKRQGQQGQQQC